MNLENRGKAVVSRSGVAKVGVAKLERAARYAGESFAYEELPGASRLGETGAARLWWLAAALALIGLVVLSLR